MKFSEVCVACRTERIIGHTRPRECCKRYSLVVHTDSIKREDGVIVDIQPVSKEEMILYGKAQQK